MNKKKHAEYLKRSDRKEEVDDTPVAMPLRFRNMGPLERRDEIRMLIREALSEAANVGGMETFEEADDFNIDDDEPEMVSPYEMIELTPEYPAGDDDEHVSDEVRPGGVSPKSEGSGEPAAAPGSDGELDEGTD